MKRTIEIDDTLPEIVQSACEELNERIADALQGVEGEIDWQIDVVDVVQDGLSEIADGCTPVYYSEIDGLFYLYGDRFEEAFDNAGIGDKNDEQDCFPNGWKAAAICYYIESCLQSHLARLERALPVLNVSLAECKDAEAQAEAVAEWLTYNTQAR